MEYCMEARALKSSLVSETAPQQVTGHDDMWCLAGINISDDFSVDDLLDFSDKDFNLQDSEQQKDSLSISSAKTEFYDDADKFPTFFSPVSGDLGPLTADELPVPVDEMENLEWLSQFVDDSVSGMSFSWLTGNCTGKRGKCDMNRSEPEAKKFTVLGLPKPVPTKPRKKRSRRPSGNIWSLGLILLTESLSSSLYSSQDSCITPPFTTYSNPLQVIDSFDDFPKPPPTKKQKKNSGEPGSMLSGSNFLRTCTHCLVQKTPQWRTGPLGPKTLCNACGVRFKSGRLFPEYRPACSPTFTGEIHSNSHRKVLEMRRNKEAVEHVMSGLGPTNRSIRVS